MEAHSKPGARTARGVKTFNYNCLQAMNISATVKRDVVGTEKNWKTFHGFYQHCEWEFGWSWARCKEERDLQWNEVGPESKAETTDRSTGKPIEWMKVDVKYYNIKEVGTDEREQSVRTGGWASDRNKPPQPASISPPSPPPAPPPLGALATPSSPRRASHTPADCLQLSVNLSVAVSDDS